MSEHPAYGLVDDAVEAADPPQAARERRALIDWTFFGWGVGPVRLCGVAGSGPSRDVPGFGGVV
ncbi:hypothetical protein ABI_23110 [Asticcacaulis biprosthecium C19]|uniref:Uncharacterized protein n=1 Tax=Asticcacaulis biprosthecium C19 TaxID=715226 RepID=F4QNJ1_9CAUL|nr:hypothetical protein [Asticcacaulis biprosthecium]EGF90899.1 hypothetical protein ABI_23110 [Asticcacaulis biprosthecium C19]